MDTMLLEEGREQRSKDVKLQFSNTDHFVVIDDEGKIKYFGELDLNSRATHECTCRSFQHGNVEDYFNTHGINFECKHIKAGYNTRTIKA